MSIAGEAEDTFPMGAIITDNGTGFPWIKNVMGTWWRQGVEEAWTWQQILDWHQAAIDDPDDDTTEPFRPVLMVPSRKPEAAPSATARSLDIIVHDILDDWPLVHRVVDALIAEGVSRTSQPVQANTDREALARELYRQLYPGYVNTHDSARTSESDLREHDRAYAIWDAGKEGWAPGGQCRDVADAILAAGFCKVEVTDDMVERAGRVMYPHWDAWGDDDQGNRELMRAALSAALGGGDHAE